MPLKLFFSWQADVPTGIGRNFIERSLQKALHNLQADADLEPAIREGIDIDRDTQGIGGSPPIVETIFKKIDGAAIFVADLTFVGKRLDETRPTPNPNVLIEYGWALKSLGYERILPIMNVSYGVPDGDSMPFNMRHLRHPLQYNLDEHSDDANRRTVRDKLIRDLQQAIRVILESEQAQRLILPESPPLFSSVEPCEGLSRFRKKAEPIGITDGINGGAPVYLAEGPALWIRLMPLFHFERTFPATELRPLVRETLLPVGSASYSEFGYVRADDGMGCFAVQRGSEELVSPAIIFVFETGELWTINTAIMSGCNDIPYCTDAFLRQYEGMATFMRDQLRIPYPYRWIAGIEGTKGRPLNTGSRFRTLPFGHCVTDILTADGEWQEGESVSKAIRPFFEKILEKCCIDPQGTSNLLPK